MIFGYCRVSTEEQSKHGISLLAQADRIKSLFPDAVILSDEGVTSDIPLVRRPAGQILLATPARLIVACKQDRLFRDAEEALSVSRGWQKAGTGLILLDSSQESINQDDPSAWMMFGLKAVFGEYEKRLIKKRTKDALQFKKIQLAKEGKRLGPPGMAGEIGELIQRLRADGKTLQAIVDVLEGGPYVPFKWRPPLKYHGWQRSTIHTYLRSLEKIKENQTA